MKPLSISTLTICGIDELPAQSQRTVTHVLSILDPNWPELEAFQAYGEHKRTTLNFHDIINPIEGQILPQQEHVAKILSFGKDLADSKTERAEGHLLIHCHMGVSRSTAAMLSLLAQTYPDESEDRLFERLQQIRPQAWPNSLMIKYADDLLGRNGKLVDALRRHYGWQLKREPEYNNWMARIGRSRELEMAV
ncbi:protein-tyrosine-phosphatase [Phyllobacterium sp. 628]|uniref:tyrosine phosphatase family protein n=1 Tax=Phyllobacterium sp. 628 TaxID=2718938 RepID=UPI0016622C84|nr:dual specificity protein phosphatase family protein [Phyllobacterium sp. 628]QND53874.1 protein-tyrosine-phosphatase [Phyllobacterium sp. 628]